MARLVQFIFFCVISAIVFSWLAGQTGMTVINWSVWEIELHTSLLVAGVAVLIAGLFLLYRLIRILVLWPGWMGHNWQVRRQKKESVPYLLAWSRSRLAITRWQGDKRARLKNYLGLACCLICCRLRRPTPQGMQKGSIALFHSLVTE